MYPPPQPPKELESIFFHGRQVVLVDAVFFKLFDLDCPSSCWRKRFPELAAETNTSHISKKSRRTLPQCIIRPKYGKLHNSMYSTRSSSSICQGQECSEEFEG